MKVVSRFYFHTNPFLASESTPRLSVSKTLVAVFNRYTHFQSPLLIDCSHVTIRL